MALPRAPLRIIAAVATVLVMMGQEASALELKAANCPDLLALPSTISEDTTLTLEEPTERYGDPDANWIVCDEVTTVHVDGAHDFVVTSDQASYNFENVRFEIKGGARVTFQFDFQLSFNYAASQGTDGGVFYVESGSSATFDVPVGTSFEGNTVEGGYSGGVLYAGGDVEFVHKVDFISNEAGTSGGSSAGNGGAVAVGPDGSVNFMDFADFTDNQAHSGGNGGALYNSGYVYFGRRSYFGANAANEDANGEGGYGGAIYNPYGGETEFKRRTIWYANEAASGGALFNIGVIRLNSNGFFRLNKATGSVLAQGGHIYNMGYNVGGDGVSYVEGFINFAGDFYNMREGQAQDGGAFYTAKGSAFGQGGVLNYYDNTASRYCNNRGSYNSDTGYYYCRD